MSAILSQLTVLTTITISSTISDTDLLQQYLLTSDSIQVLLKGQRSKCQHCALSVVFITIDPLPLKNNNKQHEFALQNLLSNLTTRLNESINFGKMLSSVSVSSSLGFGNNR